jgi:hypothetical protein
MDQFIKRWRKFYSFRADANGVIRVLEGSLDEANRANDYVPSLKAKNRSLFRRRNLKGEELMVLQHVVLNELTNRLGRLQMNFRNGRRLPRRGIIFQPLSTPACCLVTARPWCSAL